MANQLMQLNDVQWRREQHSAHTRTASNFDGAKQMLMPYRSGRYASVSKGFEFKPGFVYTQVRAISARINQNYDGWPSDELKKSYRSFLGKPVFVNHQNFDPKKARGKVVASRYVEAGDDKYIETVMEIDAHRFPKLAHEIKTGGMDSVSMGVEAGFTICSYCDNKAVDVPEFCAHVKYHKGEHLPRKNYKTGAVEDVLVYEKCFKLGFFELSYVFDPADETAVVSRVLSAATAPTKKPQPKAAPKKQPQQSAPAQGQPQGQPQPQAQPQAAPNRGTQLQQLQKQYKPPVVKPIVDTVTPGEMPNATMMAKRIAYLERVGYGEDEAPEDVDTLRDPDDDEDKDEFHHFVESPKELRGPDLDQTKRLDREQENEGLDNDRRVEDVEDIGGQPMPRGARRQARGASSVLVDPRNGRRYYAADMPPPDPSMMGGGAPPMDPSMGGGAPPMDPSMGGDPSMMGGDPSMGGGAPPPGGDPSGGGGDIQAQLQLLQEAVMDLQMAQQTMGGQPDFAGSNAGGSMGDASDDPNYDGDNDGLEGEFDEGGEDPEFDLGGDDFEDQDLGGADDFGGGGDDFGGDDLGDEDDFGDEGDEGDFPSDEFDDEGDDDDDFGDDDEAEDELEDAEGHLEDAEEDLDDDDDEDSDDEDLDEELAHLARRNGFRATSNRNKRRKGQPMSLAQRSRYATAGRRRHYADGPNVDGGPYHLDDNDQGENENLYISQTPGAEALAAPTPGDGTISNTENNLVARIKRRSNELKRDVIAYEQITGRRVHGEAVDTPDTVNPTVQTGPGGEELTGDHFESLQPDKVETQPKDASVHAFRAFDSWLQKTTGRSARNHAPTFIRRQAASWCSQVGIAPEALFPTLGSALRAAKKNEGSNRRGNMNRYADEKLELAAPQARIDVEDPVRNTTNAEAQASQFDRKDFGNNAGDGIADPDLSTNTQIWAPGEGDSSVKKDSNRKADGITAVRYAEAYIAAGLAPNTYDEKYKIAAMAQGMRHGTIVDRTALLDAINSTRRMANTRTAASRGQGLPQGLGGRQMTAGTQREAANDQVNDVALWLK